MIGSMDRRHRFGLLATAAALIAFAMPSLALAIDYPTHPVRVICPFPPGATADIVARLVGQAITEGSGQPAVVENRAGSAGNIGADLVAKAEPDGYTLLVSPPSPFAVNISLYDKLSYDSRTAFAPISVVVQSPSVLVAATKVPYKTFPDLVAYAKAHPGTINYASQGSGTTSHLTAEMMKQMLGLNIVHVPYKGSAPATADILGGQVDIMWDNLGSSMQYIKDDRMLTLAVGSATRWPDLPNVPTMVQLGYPDFLSTAWFAAAAPAKTPPEIVDKLYNMIATYVKKPDTVKRLAAIGVEPVANTPKQMADFVRAETERWAKVIKTAGIKAD
jgi:tripartite-type tricarboxylate transporter receptor subunit TctC